MEEETPGPCRPCRPWCILANSQNVRAAAGAALIMTDMAFLDLLVVRPLGFPAVLQWAAGAQMVKAWRSTQAVLLTVCLHPNQVKIARAGRVLLLHH